MSYLTAALVLGALGLGLGAGAGIGYYAAMRERAPRFSRTSLAFVADDGTQWVGAPTREAAERFVAQHGGIIIRVTPDQRKV